MEESLKEGEQWQEKFTRGARRRRSSSAGTHAHCHAQRHRIVRDELPGFGAVVSVDEVDKRHGISRTAAEPESQVLEEVDEGLLPSLTRRMESTGLSPASAIEEEDGEGFPLPSPSRTSVDNFSASCSRIPEIARSNLRPIDLQVLSDQNFLAPPLADDSDLPDEEMGPTRETIYYTPESSPTIPSLEPSSAFTSSPIEREMTPPTPMMLPVPPSSAPMPIPGSAQDHKAFFSNLSLSSFELVHAPVPPSPPLRHSHYDDHSISTASPELTEYVPTLPSSSPGRKRLMQLRNLPGPGSFFRAGAEMFKGVGGLATPGISV